MCAEREPPHSPLMSPYGANCQKILLTRIQQASIHPSDAVTERIPDWKAQGVEIFHLPGYLPELNLIEILWRFIKYYWLEFEAYLSWKHLVEYVEEILRNVGTKYCINFV